MPRTHNLLTHPTAVDAHPSQERPTSAELIGSKAADTLQRDGPLTAALGRQVVASALGLEESALAACDANSIDVALGRLRRIAETIERLGKTAANDELTGVLRRGPGMLAVKREIDREHRRRSRGIVVAFMDVDGLKRVNDTRGHAAGDQLLCDVVAGIRARTRSYDLLFRYGGDEFVLALLDVDLTQGRRILAEIQDEIARRTGGTTVSAGATVVEPADGVDEVVARADSILYLERQVKAHERSLRRKRAS
jgi:diguanylate cyclase (GGDEF)-like protein